MDQDYRVYQQEAENLALAAGALLREAYGRVAAREKAPGDLVTDADFASQALIADGVARAFPDHTFLGEETGTAFDPARPWRWVVDPLDGTINFAHGFPFWAVSIALEHDGHLVVGVIHNPLTSETFSARHGGGATRNGEPIHVSKADQLSKSLISTALPTEFAADAERQMAFMKRFSTGTHSVRRTGSSALNLAWVAAGAFEVCYATSMNPWDAAAGVVLVREAGGALTGLNGDPYDLYRGGILATNGHVHAESLRFLAEAESLSRKA